MNKMMNPFQKLKLLIYNPSLYLAGVIGTCCGALSGSLTGFIAGGFLGQQITVCTQWPASIWGYNTQFIDWNALAGALFGMTLGALIGGTATAFVTCVQVYRNPSLPKMLSTKSSRQIIRFSLMIALELAIGTIVGAILACLFYPLLGAPIGAAFGFLLMVVVTSFQSQFLT